MLHLHHGYVTFLYVPLSLVGDACAQIVAILLVYVSILAGCSALCIFEKHMLAFVDLIHALPTRGGKYPIHVSRGSLHRGKKNWVGRNAFVQGELAFMHLGALFRLNFSSFADGVKPSCLTLRSRQFWSMLSQLCRAVAHALGDRDLSHSSDLFLDFVWLLITCLSISFVSFLFLFSLNWLLVCCQCTHHGGD
jgi:hypothetical protein